MTPCSIGPRQITGESSVVRNAIDTSWMPYCSAGTIFLPSVASCVLHAEHDRHVRAVDVAVDHRDAPAGLAQGDGEIDGHGRLADAALAGADGDDVLHALDRRLPHLRRRVERTCAVISMSTDVTPGSAATRKSSSGSK